MAKRLITAAIAIPIGVFIVILDNPHVLAVVTALLSVIAVFELLSAAKYTTHRTITSISLLYSVILPLMFCYEAVREYAIPVSFAFLTLMCFAALVRHNSIRFEQIGLISLVSICIPLAFSTLAFFRFRFIEHGTFFIVFSLVVAWIADGGAYFAGTFFGKHKLCPEISPKKTWEGFFGGLVSAVVFAILLGFGYELWDKIFTGEQHFTVNVLVLGIIAVVCTFLGVLGDLVASLLKRQCGVKDFGNILPGHGGIMDRFDSVLFVAPFVYIAIQYVFPITMLEDLLLAALLFRIKAA